MQFKNKRNPLGALSEIKQIITTGKKFCIFYKLDFIDIKKPRYKKAMNIKSDRIIYYNYN